ncbi:hypothetical protein EYZ11_009547 [Aspergillus tanneri]|uniref:Uncharacterized protein n=1 Tax=Aspergillus tanneri TaxID=1220188 RepID=A0A4S3J9R4_9EURO|nr:hypothetical protein EYZ11_009547 [Aspergillus tanneri]
MDYDTLGRLIRVRDKDQELLCDYRYDAAGKLVAQIAPGQPDTYLFYSEEALIATKTDTHDSVLGWVNPQAPGKIHLQSYTPYGLSTRSEKSTSIGFNGQWRDPITGCDPVNRVDPSGHRSVLGIYFGWKTLIESILGVLASILAVIFTAGAGLAVEVAVGTVVGGVSSAAGGALGDLAEGQTPSWSSVGENFGMGLATSLAGPLVNRAFGAAKAL